MEFAEKKDCVIVGGGISGILLALKLTLEPDNAKSFTLLEENPSLGGRLFFAQSNSMSGFGFEIFNAETQESLYRHILNSLTTDEQSELDAHLSTFEVNEGPVQKNSCYFIKKELTPSRELLQGSSEIFTKKEAETLKSLAFEGENLSKPEQHGLAFEKVSLWVEMPKTTKESLEPVLESVVCINWRIIPFLQVCKILKEFFSESKSALLLPFKMQVRLEHFLENILKKRGVEIRTCCKLLRVDHTVQKKFSLFLQDEKNPTHKQLETSALILTIPIVKCAGILAKEMFSPDQSRLLSRVPPKSLVVYEISHFSACMAPEFESKFNAGDTMVFPVERAKSFVLSDNRVLFYAELEYENSLQAPSVREAISRLKRAAARVLNEDIGKEMKKGMRIPQHKFTDRVILVPVAETVPAYSKTNFELKGTRMGLPHMYCCGDSFFSFAEEPWKRVIHSVNEVVAILNK